MTDAFDGTFEGRTALVTGHTGFKGSWLSVWLEALGANVIGYSLEPPSTPSNFEVSGLSERLTDVRADVRDLDPLVETIEKYRPEIVFHLAAQSIAWIRMRSRGRRLKSTSAERSMSWRPCVTESALAVVCVTSDRCYENREWEWGYRENDRLGGHDPYSTSKAMAELAAASYRKSFFSGTRPSERARSIDVRWARG